MTSIPTEILTDTANKLLEIGRLDLARTVAELALAEDSGCANAHSVLAVICDTLGQWQAGQEHGRRAVELLPGSPQLRYNLALSTLRLDDYPAGFALMEARIDKPDWTVLAIAPSRTAERHRLLQPGEPVEGRHILVVTEQGLGDSMFARYLPLLAERGARIAVARSPPLRSIFEHVAGVATLLSPPPEQPLGKINLSRAEFDAWVPLLSLPRYFATDFATMPVATPYLDIDPLRTAAWRRRYEVDGRSGMPKIGLVFQANPESGSVTERSVPIGDLAPLLRTAGIGFVNLQGGAAGRRLAAPNTCALSMRPQRRCRSTSSPPRWRPPICSSPSTRWRRIAPALWGIRYGSCCRFLRTGAGGSGAITPRGTRPRGCSGRPLDETGRPS
jgi:hypothetical protein